MRITKKNKRKPMLLSKYTKCDSSMSAIEIKEASARN